MRRTIIYMSLLFILLSKRSQAQSPNIIVIIADDMGWNQVSSDKTTSINGTSYPSDFFETPNIDNLASEGIAFPNAYVNGANCAPTRAAILSGQYAARDHNNIFTVDIGGDGLNRGNTAANSTLIGPEMGINSNNLDEIPSSAITIAETLKAAEYTTAHFGKYHVGEYENEDSFNNAPKDQGFDFNYGGGTDGGPGSGGYFATSASPYTFNDNVGLELDVFADPYSEVESMELSIDHDNYPLTGTPKHVTDALVEAAFDFMDNHSSDPFFMHFSNYAIHGPFNPQDARVDLRAKYNDKETNTSSSIYNHDSKPGQAALAEGMDQAIGRLVQYLKDTDDPRRPGHKLSENTLVYFISDNGDAIKRSVNFQEQSPLKGMKGEYYEGGIRNVTFVWSEASWLANKGTVNETPIIAFDIYPTLAEAANTSLPENYDIDGQSQWQMLTTGALMTRESLFWHHPGYLIDSKRDSRPVTVVRKGAYKLMHFYETSEYELYDLSSDLNEATNLLPTNNQDIINLANDLIADMRGHLIETSAPMPTYRNGGGSVPYPNFLVKTSSCVAIDSPTAFWDFDTGNNTNDTTGNDNNSVSSTIDVKYSTTDFKEGDRSIVFDGATSIEYSNAEESFLRGEISERSVSVWIKPSNLIGVQNIFDEGGTSKGIALRLNNNNLELVVRSSTATFVELDTVFPSDDEWHHIAFIYDGRNSSNQNVTLYLDGVSVASITNSIPELIGNHSGSGIGGRIGGGDSFGNTENNFFKGKMDAFAVYDNVLSGSAIENAVQTFYYDADEDGYASSKVLSCSNPGPGFNLTELSLGDCDDSSNQIHPNAIELPDGLDNDCDGLVDEEIVYEFNDSWSPVDVNGFQTDASIIITSGDAIINQNTSSNSITINPGSSLTLDAGINITTKEAALGLTLESTSSTYSSLFIEGRVSGNIFYKRYVNAYTDDGVSNDNDLVSAPLTGQTFGDFAVANSNLFENPSAPTEKAFAPFDKASGSYINYDTSVNASTLITAGTGYRAASSDGDTFIFTGTVETGNVSLNITDSGAAYADWNLIGNPYPSYVDLSAFLNHEVASGVKNIDLLEAASGVYGYDGDLSNGWDIITLANVGTRLLAPGQGFFVAADADDVAAYDLEFTPSMRTTGSDDDFIVGRNSNPLTFLELNTSTINASYNTSFYFNDTATSGLDAGYDAVLWGDAIPDFSIYSHLVEDNTGAPMALQALASTDVSDSTVPLGVVANAGEVLTFSISDLNLPTNIKVYLEDTVTSAITLLTEQDYSLTPTVNLTGTGRFFLRFSDSALSLADSQIETIQIYKDQTQKTVFINGLLTQPTIGYVYDLQGRVVQSKALEANRVSQQMDVSRLSTGIYLVTITNNQNRYTKKIVVN